MLSQKFIESVNDLRELPGGEIFDSLIESLTNTDPEIGVRVNTRKSISLPQGADPVPWSSGKGFYINNGRPAFTFDPSLHQGLYYVQDPSSMVISSVIKQIVGSSDKPLVYIDACAAPGGKTTAAIDALPPGSLVIANEYDRRRAEILRENVMKWGSPDVVITQGDTSRFKSLEGIADIVAIDAPCSGEGMMRKDETAASQWSPQLVDSCSDLQYTIFYNMWRTLRPGGFLIYSTCTFNHIENEINLRRFIHFYGATLFPFTLPGNCGISTALFPEDFPSSHEGGEIFSPVFRFIPGRTRGEGLFIALLRKPETYADNAKNLRPVKTRRSTKTLPPELTQWLTEPDSLTLTTDGDSVYAIPKQWEPLIAELSRHLDIIYSGIHVATTKGRDMIPAHALALSTRLNINAFTTLPVTYRQAIAYLRRETITIDGAPRGIILLTYNDRPLGFVKNLGNRANNLYPPAWAIKSTHSPETPPSII